MYKRGQELYVDLMADPVPRRYRREVLEGLLGPFEEGVPLLVPGEIDVLVPFHGVRASCHVRLYGVVDDEVHGDDGVDGLRIPADFGDGFPHGGEVGDGGPSGKVLKEDPCGDPRDIHVVTFGRPRGDVPHVLVSDGLSPLPEDAFDQDPDRVRDLLEVLHYALVLQFPKAEDGDLPLGGHYLLGAVSDSIHGINLYTRTIGMGY
jgi:hypothetical protein